jgi:hypothetical protein
MKGKETMCHEIIQKKEIFGCDHTTMMSIESSTNKEKHKQFNDIQKQYFVCGENT